MNTKHIYESLWYGICLNLPGFLSVFIPQGTKQEQHGKGSPRAVNAQGEKQ